MILPRVLRIKSLPFNTEKAVTVDKNLSFGPFIGATNGTKLFDLRSYFEKPLCGHRMDALSIKSKNLNSLEQFLSCLDNKEVDRFNTIFLKSNRVHFLINELKNASFVCDDNLPIIKMDVKETQLFTQEGLYISSDNIKNHSLYLYLPLTITNSDLCDLIAKIKRIINYV